MAATRAITIGAPPELVWVWLSQIGHGRGGLYSYDDLENLMGCDLHSADRILEDLAPLEPGELVALGPEGYPAFRVGPRSTRPVPSCSSAPTPNPRSAEVPRRSGCQRIHLGVAAATDRWRRHPSGLRQRYCYPPSMSVLWHVVDS